MAVDGVALGCIGAGSLFLYAGLKGKSLLSTVQSVVKGQPPSSAATANAISGTSSSDLAALGVTSTGNAIPGSPGGSSGSGSGSGSGASGTAAGAPHVSGNYTHAQLMQLWQSVGGSASTANNAACHAIQESSGRPGVTSPNPDGGTNVGLWQLDTRGKGAGYSVAQLSNPVINARVAVQGSSNGTDWSAWATPGC